jgi:hypothetical protein
MKSLPTVAILSALTACGSTRTALPPPGEPLVVPGVEGSYYVFRGGAIEREPDGWRQAVPVEAGLPAAVSVDANGGWAAVAYEHALYSVQLSEGRVVPIGQGSWVAAPGAIGVVGGLVGTAEDAIIGLYRVADGQRQWSADGESILAEAGLRELRFVLPISASEIVLVGFKGMDPLGYPDTRIVKLDRSGGAAEIVNEQPVRNMHWLRACASDGQLVYLAGERDRVVTLPGRNNQQLVQSLLVVQVDPSDMSVRTLVQEEMPGREVRVRRIAAGFGLVAVVLDGGELRVYRVQDGAATSSVYANRYAQEVSAACLDADRVVVVSGDSTQVVEVR